MAADADVEPAGRAVDYTDDLPCPILGLFGDEDKSPHAGAGRPARGGTETPGKNYEFHMYPGAGHGFFYYDRPAAYRPEQAVDGWQKVWDFFGRTLR